MFAYYKFLQTFHREPVDPDDLFDGMRNIAAENAVMDASLPRRDD
jgi:hypothetical protein